MNLETWDSIITSAEKRGRFLIRDQQAVGEWATCAVGEHRGKYREFEYTGGIYEEPGEPIGIRIKDLGITFAETVCAEDAAEARRVWGKIQTYFKDRKPVTA